MPFFNSFSTFSASSKDWSFRIVIKQFSVGLYFSIAIKDDFINSLGLIFLSLISLESLIIDCDLNK
jgi:hypothetical protein